MTKMQRIKELGRRSGVFPTRVIDEALDAFERTLGGE
jgi:hypothetical protein